MEKGDFWKWNANNEMEQKFERNQKHDSCWVETDKKMTEIFISSDVVFI